MKNIGYWVIGIICIIATFFVTKAFMPKCPQIKSDTAWLKPKDSIKFVVKYQDTGTIKYKDTGTLKIKLIPDTNKTKQDSLKIYKDYFAQHFYNRVIVDNSELFVSLGDSITQNKLYGGLGKYLIKRPTQIINNNPQQPLVNQLYVGGILSGSTNIFGVGARITLKTKKEALWSIQTQYLPQLNNHLVFSISHDIKIKL